MRAYAPLVIEPELGTTRKVRQFLWFPMTLDYVTRWMEEAEWEEKFTDVSSYYDRHNGWKPIRWTDLGEEKEIDNRRRKILR